MVRPRILKETREGSREVILDAARCLFVEEGFDSISMRRIAKRAGLSAGALYLYFQDKTEILFALQAEGFARLISLQKSLQSIADPSARLRKHGELYVTFALDHPAYYEVMFLMPAPQRAPEAQASLIAGQAYGLLLGTVAECVRAGFLTGDVEALALAIWAGVHGLASLLLRSRVPGVRTDAQARRVGIRAQHALHDSMIVRRKAERD